MTKCSAFRATFSSAPVWMIAAAMLAVSGVASVADTSEQPVIASDTVDEPAHGPEPVPRAKSAKPSVEPAKSLPEDDYYSKRAKSRLVEDAADAAKQISLQAAYPGHNVVMCEAGCYGGASRIVQFAPKVATNIEIASTLEPTAATLPAQGAHSESNAMAVAQPVEAAASGDITCVAGCYGQVRSYRSASTAAVQAAARAEADALMAARSAVPARETRQHGATGADANRWMTTSTKAHDTPKRDAGRSAALARKKRATMANAPRAVTNPSGEWFQQINSDRVSRTR